MKAAAPHAADLCKGRYSEAGRIYHVTTATYNRQPLFDNLSLAQSVIKTLYMSGKATTLAYVLMPDHLHWLIQLQQGDLSRTVQQMKSKNTLAIHQQQGTTGQIWQRGFHDHALRKEEDIVAVARYIVANPLRARLVKSIGDYPFWNAVWL